MQVTFTGTVVQGDETIVRCVRASDGEWLMFRHAAILTDEEEPALIYFYERDPDLISIYPLKKGAVVRVTADERDIKHGEKTYDWHTNRTILKVEYISQAP